MDGGIDASNTSDHACGICKQPYTDPRLLHCMHTFCYGCIVQLLNVSDHQDVVCPMCRFVTKVGVDGHPSQIDSQQREELFCDFCYRA